MTNRFFTPLRVVSVGLGGIGTAYIDRLARMMSRYKGWPRELVVIDGDVYTEKNMDRQQILESDIGQQKAQCWAKSLAQAFKGLSVSAVTAYVGDTLIKDVVTEKSIVLLGVDNHPTRKLFSEFAEKNLKDVVIISGGNEQTTGSVMTYIREGGEDVTPSFTAFHPEIANPKGKNPADMSCAELAKLDGGSQTMNANGTAAQIMLNVLDAVINHKREIVLSMSEVYFDSERNIVVPKLRFVPGKEVETKEEAPAKKSKKKSKAEAQSAKVAVSAVAEVEPKGTLEVLPPAEMASAEAPSPNNETNG